jgi:hypothetical protein
MKILTLIMLSIIIPIDCADTSEQMRGMSALIDEPDVCNNNTKILILVKSEVSHSAHRMVIRETWAALATQYFSIPVLFVVGRSIEPVDTEKIVKESLLFQDILMADFMDNVYNLTMHPVFSLNWFHERCGRSVLALVDDDVIVNPANLIRFTDKPLGEGIHCLMMHEDHEQDEVSPDAIHWPDYCNGAGVIMDNISAAKLVTGALNEHIDPVTGIEDLFVYGIVRQRMGLRITDTPSIRVFGFDEQTDCFPEIYEKVVIIGTVTWDRMFVMWDKEKVIQTEGCRPIYEKKWFLILVIPLIMTTLITKAMKYKHRFRRVSVISNI